MTTLPSAGLAALVVAAALALAGCERTDTVQRGYRGLGMTQLYTPASVAHLAEINQIPEPEPVDPPDADAPSNQESFRNVQVLKDLTVLEFSRLMQAMSTWIAPEEGCDFCHNPKKLESDEKYTKVVARRMLQMTRAINTQWKDHVGATGVTCWTCHRGEAVPSGDWFSSPSRDPSEHMLGNRAGQNTPGMPTVGNSSLPFDPLSTFLTSGHEVRVQTQQALARGRDSELPRISVKSAEATYGLMIYMSNSLGVNCNFCHNTRAMGRWEESTPQRVTAWHGIRLVRQLNTDYLTPLLPQFPAMRLSATGDGPKVGCETCHKKTYKPLYGNTMLNDYPELAGVIAGRPLDGSKPPASPHGDPAAAPAPLPAPPPAKVSLAPAGR